MSFLRIIAAIILVGGPLLAQAAPAQPAHEKEQETTISSKMETASWLSWKSKIHTAIVSAYRTIQKQHPEYQSAAADRPSEITFQVTSDGTIGNIGHGRRSGMTSFDSDAYLTILMVSVPTTNEFALPRECSERFVKCSIRLYPHGSVSDLAIVHPVPGEAYEDKTILIPYDQKQRISPPEVVAF